MLRRSAGGLFVEVVVVSVDGEAFSQCFCVFSVVLCLRSCFLVCLSGVLDFFSFPAKFFLVMHGGFDQGVEVLKGVLVLVVPWGAVVLWPDVVRGIQAARQV